MPAKSDTARHRASARAAYKAALSLFSFSRDDAERLTRAKIVDALAEECRQLGLSLTPPSDYRPFYGY